VLHFFSHASSIIENASSDLRMPFQRFYECLRLELEMLPPTFENAFQRIENASRRIENAFRRIENASFSVPLEFESSNFHSLGTANILLQDEPVARCTDASC